MNPYRLTIPGVPRVQNFSGLGTMGVRLMSCTTALVVIPRSAPDRRFSLCKTGSLLTIKSDGRHKGYRLEGEKQREPQLGSPASYMRPNLAGDCGTRYPRVAVLGQGFASDDRMQMACET